jgi:hypothetical protein
MYNETFYESGTKNGYCFIWGEENGQRGANEIYTIMTRARICMHLKVLKYAI